MLDEMFRPQIAEELRMRGHDAVAIAGNPELVGMADEHLVRLATTEERALVTENVRDFEILRSRRLSENRPVAGLIYTNRQRFARDKRWSGRIVTALDERLRTGRIPGPGQVDWLT
ncbi:DUF5615 family PIN-like protein [Georgenia yuyongxinii]